MIDPLAVARVAVSSSPSPASFALLAMSGAVLSIGPCVAPRYLAVAALASSDRRPLLVVASFIAGLVLAFALLGAGVASLASWWRFATPVGVVLALTLALGGIVTIARAAGACVHRHMPAAMRARSSGGLFVLGAASALVISPCCTPIVVGVIGSTVAARDPLLGASLAAAFAIGHAAPLVFAAGTSALTPILRRLGSSQAPAIVSGTLMLALGAYYGLLA